MDPNVTLTELRDLNNRLASAMTDDERYQVSEQFRSKVFQLDQWLSGGGSLPDDWYVGGVTVSDLVPEEAIEAACLAMNDGVWSSHHRERWEPQVMTALAAAAPLILAAWAESVASEFWSNSHISKVLRARASVLRGEGDPK